MELLLFMYVLRLSPMNQISQMLDLARARLHAGWLQLRFRLHEFLRLRLLDGIFIGLVVLDLVGKEFN